MKDVHVYLICPKCFQQDCLHLDTYARIAFPADMPRGKMEGEYNCPYGCKTRMNMFAIGDYESVCKKSDELVEKYYQKQIDMDNKKICFF